MSKSSFFGGLVPPVDITSLGAAVSQAEASANEATAAAAAAVATAATLGDIPDFVAPFTTGDVLVATGVDDVGRVAGVATGNALLSGGVGVGPSFGKVGLTTHVSGTLPAANGGTGAVSLTDHGVLVGAGVGAITALTVGPANSVLQGAAGANPAFTTTPGVEKVTITPASGTANQGVVVNQTGVSSGTTAGTVTNASLGNPALAYNQVFVSADGADVSGATSPKYTFANNVAMVTGGANSTGGKIAQNVYLYKATASNPAAIRDHIALNVMGLIDAGDGGTDTGAGAKGTMFGAGFGASARSGATNLFEVAGMEVDTGLHTGSSARYLFGISNVNNGDLNAAEQSAAYELGATVTPWATGLLFASIHGAAPISTAGTLIGHDGTARTVTNGINFGTWTITGNSLSFPNFAVTGAGVIIANTLTVNGGQIAFPASQNASANANTLDDYEEGTWTPVVTFATPGNLAITYSFQTGVYTKIGRLTAVNWVVASSSFTHTTASGNLTLTGLPFASANVAGQNSYGSCMWGGITKATYTSVASLNATNTATILLQASGSGVAASLVTAADTPTGGALNAHGGLQYVT